MKQTRKILVIDSSVMVKWINSQNEDYLEEADQILHDARSEKVELIAPELAKYEIGNALLYKNMSLPTSKMSLGTIYEIPLTFCVLDQEGASETMEIAKENKITYYDASFVQLTKEKKATLVTANPKHHRQFEGVKVIDLKDYR